MNQLLKLSPLALLISGLLASHVARAEPFVVEDMPEDLDGTAYAWSDARKPIAADFNGDGQASWYAGGNRIAHPKLPTPLDPLRFGTAALPGISLNVCPSCTAVGNAFAVADFNSDGRPDIARIVEWAGHTGAYTLQIYLGNGSDGFTLGDRRDWTDSIGNSLGHHAYQLRAADLDSDGDSDLAILSVYQYTDYEADPHINRGNLKVRWNSLGAFATESTIQSLQFDDQSRLVVGDFDRDTDVDMLVNFQTTWNGTQSYTAASRLFTNQGGGNFTGSTDSSFDVQFFHEPMSFADFNRNGQPQFLTFSGNLAIREYTPGTGWAGFQSYGAVEGSGATYASPLRSLALAVGDLDENGTPDVVTAEGPTVGDPRNLVLHRTGFAGSSASTQVLASFASTIRQIGIGDARGDADLDLLVRLANGSFKFLRNTAPRRISVFNVPTQTNALTGLTRLETGDVNRDGIADLLALKPAQSGSHMEQALGNGVYGFGAAEFKILANTPSDFAVGDFNNDDRLDYAYVVPNLGAVRTVIQNDSSFFGWTDSKIADFAGASTIAAGRVVNADEYLDLFAGSNTNGALLALRNTGTAWSTSNPRTAHGIMPATVAILPNYLGIADSPIACGADGLSYQMQAYTVSLGWGQTAGLTSVQSVGQTGICEPVNLDNDSAMEIVFMEGTGKLVWWNPTSTTPSPTSVIDNSPPSVINGIADTDWNRDGLRDLLVAADSGLYLYTREGSTETWMRRTITLAAAKDVVAIDANRDSLPDAAFTTAQGISVVRNLSEIAEALDVNYPNGLPAVLSPGQSAISHTTEIANPGRFEEDASIAVTGAKVFFKKVVYAGPVWSPGAAMTKSEVEQAVASVAILMDGQTIGNTGTAAVAGDGSLQINFVPGLSAVVKIAPDSLKNLEYRVTLKSTAGAAAYTEFMLVSGDITTSVVDGNTPTSITSLIETSPYNLIRINPNLFSHGFE